MIDRIALLTAAIGLLAGGAMAADGAAVTAASGDIQQNVWVIASPTPGWCAWTSAEGVTAYQATEADGSGNADCAFPWLALCDADSLVFQGSFPAITSPNVWASDYVVDLACTLDCASPQRLRAGRVVDGMVPDGHTVTVVWPDGTEMPLLAAGTGQDVATVDLPAGVYGIRLHVYARQNADADDVTAAYDGRVAVTWEKADTVPTAPVSWGSLKSSYRH